MERVTHLIAFRVERLVQANRDLRARRDGHFLRWGGGGGGGGVTGAGCCTTGAAGGLFSASEG